MIRANYIITVPQPVVENVKVASETIVSLNGLAFVSLNIILAIFFGKKLFETAFSPFYNFFNPTGGASVSPTKGIDIGGNFGLNYRDGVQTRVGINADLDIASPQTTKSYNELHKNAVNTYNHGAEAVEKTKSTIATVERIKTNVIDIKDRIVATKNNIETKIATISSNIDQGIKNPRFIIQKSIDAFNTASDTVSETSATIDIVKERLVKTQEDFSSALKDAEDVFTAAKNSVESATKTVESAEDYISTIKQNAKLDLNVYVEVKKDSTYVDISYEYKNNFAAKKEHGGATLDVGNTDLDKEISFDIDAKTKKPRFREIVNSTPKTQNDWSSKSEPETVTDIADAPENNNAANGDNIIPPTFKTNSNGDNNPSNNSKSFVYYSLVARHKMSELSQAKVSLETWETPPKMPKIVLSTDDRLVKKQKDRDSSSIYRDQFSE